MLGTAVQAAVPSTVQLVALRHAQLAIEDAQAVERAVARERPELKVVNDQQGRPTYAPDLATALWKLVACDARGTVHCANEGAATWFDVAKAAIEIAGLHTTVVPCSTADMPRPARRPQYSVLDCTRYQGIVGSQLRGWQAGLGEYVPINILTPR